MQYNNVTEMNGASGDGATPLINRLGRIEFSGTNVFNVTGNSMTNFGSGKQDPGSLGSANGSLATDQAGWIHGANAVNVVSGSTTLNMNTKISSPFFHYNNSDVSYPYLNISKNAKLTWNIDNSAYLEDDSYGSMSSHNWTIDDGGSFIINGTANTARNKWFNTTVDTNFKINKKASLVATTGNALNLPVNSGTSAMNIQDQGNVSIANLSDSYTRYTISGNFYRGNVHLGNDSHLLIRAKNGYIFQLFWNYFYLDGTGLTGKFSKYFDGSNASNEDATTGKIGLRALGMNDDELARSYSGRSESILSSQPSYIEFGQEPTILTFTGSLDRLYSLTSSDLPQNSTDTTGLISGQGNMWFNINSNNPNPAVRVTLSMSENHQDGIVSYFWKKNNSNDSDSDDPAPITSNPTTIWSSSGKKTTSDDSGNNYKVNYDKDHGLMMKTTNALKAGTEYDGATFDYTLVSGVN